MARLSIETAAAIGLNTECRDVDTLFRILMQCQIIDDVLDYDEDVVAGLPSFLTASASLPQAMALTGQAARSYAATDEQASGRGVLPLRVALSVVTALTMVVVRVAGWRQRHARQLGVEEAC